MIRNSLLFFFCLISIQLFGQKTPSAKPRVLISTDIGGTDPDDNQSMAHLLMYSDLFDLEGLVSSPSYGSGNKEEILRMIDLYEKDLPLLQKHKTGFASPNYLRSITKQGRKGAAPFKGFISSTEGSDWIIKAAKKKDSRPLWVLVWGGLDDLAQALHDAPEIQENIRVYWIGGPNKKWSANSYAYIAANFPDLWMIEVNSSYYGFFSNNQTPDVVKTTDFYQKNIQEAGHLGADFKDYYDGEIKMGDTPSLLYLMNGYPGNPTGESWGGSFEKIDRSSRVIFERKTSLSDSVAFCTVVEYQLKGPKIEVPADSAVFWMEVPYGDGKQVWPGYFLGNGTYSLRYAPKQAEVLNFVFTSEIEGFPTGESQLVVTNLWPGKANPDDFILGENWYSDSSKPEDFDGRLQGGNTILKWRNDILNDWATRWSWLK
ncbi:nucleoside hydrolase-like domain-containing protein [Algoriphagus sp. PAP.12]|uniref:nucleoside hydrolase-like domain-containing protein n=1 Tax=Algoriphagus sp. PAP.12 TaxID=2996678 RepID=UPI00227D6338|nr:nucleoside hydrolase-like domain-containing protein [Algoriphagus sp. PAP.12]